MDFFVTWLKLFITMLIPILWVGFYVSRPTEFIPGRAFMGK